jgi:hypothetical protein
VNQEAWFDKAAESFILTIKLKIYYNFIYGIKIQMELSILFGSEKINFGQVLHGASPAGISPWEGFVDGEFL